MATHTRVATISEAGIVAELLYYAYKDFAYSLCNTEDHTIMMERFKQLVLHDTPLPMSLHTYRVIVDKNDKIIGGFGAFPIIKTLELYQNLYKALLGYRFFESLDTKVKISPRLMTILGNDTIWQIPYIDSFYLDSFAIAEDQRGKGLSSLMMDCVKEHALEEDCEAVVLLARENMVRFYSNLNFNTSQFNEGEDEDFFVMHLPFK